MSRRPVIGAGQLFCYLLLSRVVLTLTYSINFNAHTIGPTDWLAALLLPPFLLALALPAFVLRRRSGPVSVCEYAFSLSKPLGRAVSLLYGAGFFLLTVLPVSRFSFFVTSTLQPEKSPLFFPLLLLLPACYAVCRGLEAIFRLSALLSVVCLLSLLAIVAVLLPRFDSLNILSPFYEPRGALGLSLLLLLSNSLEVFVVLMLPGAVRGGVKKAYLGYALVAPLFLFLIFYTVLAVLGPYSALQMFPFYTAAGVAKVGELRNLSAVAAAVWILGVFAKSSLSLLLCRRCLLPLTPKAARPFLLPALGAAATACAAWNSATMAENKLNFSMPLMLGVVGVYLIALPLLLAALGKRKENRHRETPAVPAR